MSFSTYQHRKKNGLCSQCGAPKPAEHKGHCCQSCQDKLLAERIVQRGIRRVAGLCIRCGKPASTGKTRCEPCCIYDATKTKKRVARLAAAGICVACGQMECLPALKVAGPNHRLCETCYLKKTAKHCLGCGALWRIIRERFYAQGQRCTYTGTALVLGINDSLDHIKPLKHYPELRSDPTNTEWVCREINEMKRDRTPEQFLALIQTVIAYRQS